MKVIIDPNGVVSLDISNGEAKEAAELIRLLQNGFHAPPLPLPTVLKKPIPKVKSRKPIRLKNGGALPPALFEALKLLARNDVDDGLPAEWLASHVGMSAGGARQRLEKLVKSGYAYRVSPGKFRAVKPPEMP